MSAINKLLEHYFQTTQSLYHFEKELKELYLVACGENEKEIQNSISQLIEEQFMKKSFEKKRDFLYEFFIFDLPFYYNLWKNEFTEKAKNMALIGDPEAAVSIYYIIQGKVEEQFIPKIALEIDEIIIRELSKIDGFTEMKKKEDLKNKNNDAEILSFITNFKKWKGNGQRSIVALPFKLNHSFSFIQNLDLEKKNNFELLFNNFNEYLTHKLKNYDFYDLFKFVEYKNENLTIDLHKKEILFSLELNTVESLTIEKIKKSLSSYLEDFFQKEENTSFRFENEIFSLLLD